MDKTKLICTVIRRYWVNYGNGPDTQTSDIEVFTADSRDCLDHLVTKLEFDRAE